MLKIVYFVATEQITETNLFKIDENVIPDFMEGGKQFYANVIYSANCLEEGERKNVFFFLYMKKLTLIILPSNYIWYNVLKLFT